MLPSMFNHLKWFTYYILSDTLDVSPFNLDLGTLGARPREGGGGLRGEGETHATSHRA